MLFEPTDLLSRQDDIIGEGMHVSKGDVGI